MRCPFAAALLPLVLLPVADAFIPGPFHPLDVNQDARLSPEELASFDGNGTVLYKTRPHYKCLNAANHPSTINCTQGVFDVVQECKNEPNVWYTSWEGSNDTFNCMLYEPVIANSVPWVLDEFFRIEENPADNVYDRVDPANRRRYLCGMHASFCRMGKATIPPAQPACKTKFDGCRSALRHLVAMMFKSDFATQQCNNFALKSIRGLFHDYMSVEVDGSIFFEMDEPMNHGLCRWTQYINVLSDHTKCEPAAIIKMAGLLGMEACGHPVWRYDAGGQTVNFNKGFDCNSTNGNRNTPLWDANGHRKPEFDDIAASSNSTSFERLWCAMNWHPCGYPSEPGDRQWSSDPTQRPYGNRMLTADANPAEDPTVSDGEVQYSTQLTASAHIIGRVTCPVTGQSSTANPSAFNAAHGTFAEAGYFHKPRGQKDYMLADGTMARASLLGIDGLRARMFEGLERFKQLQCHDTAPEIQAQNGRLVEEITWVGPSAGDWAAANPGAGSQTGGFRGNPRFVSNGGLRNSTPEWPLLPGETALNSISGACGMPTFSFWGRTIIAGFPGQAVRALSGMTFQSYDSQNGRPGSFTNNEVCRAEMNIHIPTEAAKMKSPDAIPIPTSPALQRFLDIAWDGVDTISSAWDSCDPVANRCDDLNVAGNSICTQGEQPGLSDFQWNGWTQASTTYVPPATFEWTRFMDNGWETFVDCQANPNECKTGSPATPGGGGGNNPVPSPLPSPGAFTGTVVNVAWNWGTVGIEYNVTVGDKIVFQWSSQHNVQRMRSLDCSQFYGDIYPTSPFEYVFVQADVGATYWGCSVSGHCNDMKIKVNVAPSSAPSGSTNPDDSSGGGMSIGLVVGVVAACTVGVGVAAVAVYRRKDDRTRWLPWGIHWGTKDDRTKTAVGADAFGPAVSKPPL